MPKVQQLHEVGVVGMIAQENVFGLDVPMDQTLLVRGSQRRRALFHDPHDRPLVEGPDAREARRQRLSFQELHDDAVQRPELSEVRDLDDVRVADVVDRAGLREEPGDHLGIVCDFGVQHLDRRLATDEGVFAQVNAPHPASTKLAEHPVRADRRSEQSVADDHRRRERCIRRTGGRRPNLKDRRHI